MATVAELERLDALVSRLTPLASVQRGELIRAEDWNVVVGALLEALRAVLSGEKGASAAVHEHVDEVNIGWLDPRLRALVERGPLAEPGAVARVDRLDRRIVQATEQLGTLDTRIVEARTIASDLATRDEKRETDLHAIRRTVESIPDAREDVLTLRESLRGIQTDVRRAIEIGEGLEVGGVRFDAAAYDERLRGVEALRARMTAPDGTLFDAASLERRLTSLTNQFVTRGDLDTAIGGHQFELTPDQFATLEDGLTNRLQDRFTDQLNASAGTLRGEMATRFGEVDELVGRSIADALPNISENVLGSVRAEIAGGLADGRAEILSTVESRMGALEGGLLNAVDGRLDGLEGRVAATIMPQVEGRIATAVAPIRSDVNRIDERTRANADSITRLDQNQATLSTRVEVVARNDEQARRALQSSIMADVDGRLQQQSTSFEGRLATIDRQIQDRISVAIKDATVTLTSQVEQIASTAARREAQIASNQLLGQIREIAREEANVVFTDFRRDVRTELDANFDRVSGLVSSEVRRQTATLPELVRNEVNLSRDIRTTPIRNIDTTRIGPGGGG